MQHLDPTMTVKRNLSCHAFWGWWLYLLVIPLIAQLIWRQSMRLLVYGDRFVVERGIFNVSRREIFFRDVRTMEVQKSIFQRMFKLGNLAIATAGTAGWEFVVDYIKEPERIQAIVTKAKADAAASASQPTLT